MTENEKKQIQVMHNERKRRQEAKIAAMNAADPKGVTRDDLRQAMIPIYLLEQVDIEKIEINGKWMTIREATEIALAEIFEHAGGAGIAAYDYSRALFIRLFLAVNGPVGKPIRERMAKILDPQGQISEALDRR
jgi:hypothetical protein